MIFVIDMIDRMNTAYRYLAITQSLKEYHVLTSIKNITVQDR
jgi:hypothetical protein